MQSIEGWRHQSPAPVNAWRERLCTDTKRPRTPWNSKKKSVLKIMAEREGFEPSPLIDNTELIDSALLQMLQVHKMLYIITPDYTQADERSLPRKGY